jgi:hypothetical protein
MGELLPFHCIIPSIILSILYSRCRRSGPDRAHFAKEYLVLGSFMETKKYDVEELEDDPSYGPIIPQMWSWWVFEDDLFRSPILPKKVIIDAIIAFAKSEMDRACNILGPRDWNSYFEKKDGQARRQARAAALEVETSVAASSSARRSSASVASSSANSTPKAKRQKAQKARQSIVSTEASVSNEASD